jgi:hypothetical protein
VATAEGREQLERLPAGAADRTEMTPVQGDDQTGSKPFGKGDDRGIDSAEWKIAVLMDQGAYSLPVRRLRRPNVEIGESCDKSSFDNRTKTGSD